MSLVRDTSCLFSPLLLPLVLCCPMTSLMGFVLGLIALRRIQASGGALGGRKDRENRVDSRARHGARSVFHTRRFPEDERASPSGGSLKHSMSILFDVESVKRDDDLLRVFSTLEGRRPSRDEIDMFVDEVLSSLGMPIKDFPSFEARRETPVFSIEATRWRLDSVSVIGRSPEVSSASSFHQEQASHMRSFFNGSSCSYSLR